MGLHHNLAIGLLAASLTVPASAQWRDWTDPHIAVEDLSAAVWERLECTFTGIATDEVAVCVGDETVTVTNIYRAYGWRLDWRAHTNTPIAWTEQVRLTAGTNLVIAGYQTDRWTKVVGTVTSEVVAVYTNWMTQDYSIITNADCTVVTSELATVVWTSAPTQYIPAGYIAALDAAIVDMSDPPNSTRRRLSPWRLYDPAAFDPAANCTTSWLWTVRDQWEPWRYTYPAEPALITHSQLCARAGLSITTIVDSVTDRGAAYPKSDVVGYLTQGWQTGELGTHTLNPAVPVTEYRHRYVTNLFTSGLWTYATLPALRAHGPDTNTPFLGRILGTLTAVRSVPEVVYYQVWHARGLGYPDGLFRYDPDSFSFTNAGYYLWAPDWAIVGPRYITSKKPKYPADYLHPESNALWLSSGIAQDVPDPQWPWQARGFAGCYIPARPSITTTGDVAPAARWHYRQGDTAWGYKDVVLQPAALPAYLWVTINSTNDRYCSGAVEPTPIPDPLSVEVVGSWWRPAVATQGVTLVVSTQTVQITQAGRIDLANPLTSIISMTASNALGGTELYTRDGVEITAHLGEYTNALSMINAPAAWWLNSEAGWEAFKPVLEDRKKMLSAMAGLGLVVEERWATNTLHVASSTNVAEAECSSKVWDWPFFPYGEYVGAGFSPCGDNYYNSGLVGGPVGTDCVSAELEATPGGASPSTAWSISSMCAITLNRYDATIRIQENISYSEGAGEPAAYDSQWVASSYNRGRVAEEVVQKDTSRISGILTERVPGALSFYSRATPSGYANEKASVLSGITYQTTPKEGEGCSGDGSLQEVDERADEVVYRPKFYGVETLVLYGAASTVERDGFSFSVDVPHPEWPAGRMEYAFTNKATGAGAASFQCQSVDDFMDYSIEASFTASRTEDSTERKHYDGYSVEWFLSFAPEWRFQ